MPSVPNLPSSSFLSDSNLVSISEPKIDQTIKNYHNIMLSVNCRSLVSNFELLKPIVKKCNPKIIAVSEIWRATAASLSYLTEAADKIGLQLTKTLTGQAEKPPRWKMCVGATTGALSNAVGSLYVSKYFSEKSKASSMLAWSASA